VRFAPVKYFPGSSASFAGTRGRALPSRSATSARSRLPARWGPEFVNTPVDSTASETGIAWHVSPWPAAAKASSPGSPRLSSLIRPLPALVYPAEGGLPALGYPWWPAWSRLLPLERAGLLW